MPRGHSSHHRSVVHSHISHGAGRSHHHPIRRGGGGTVGMGSAAAAIQAALLALPKNHVPIQVEPIRSCSVLVLPRLSEQYPLALSHAMNRDIFAAEISALNAVIAQHEARMVNPLAWLCIVPGLVLMSTIILVPIPHLIFLFALGGLLLQCGLSQRTKRLLTALQHTADDRNAKLVNVQLQVKSAVPLDVRVIISETFLPRLAEISTVAVAYEPDDSMCPCACPGCVFSPQRFTDVYPAELQDIEPREAFKAAISKINEARAAGFAAQGWRPLAVGAAVLSVIPWVGFILFRCNFVQRIARLLGPLSTVLDSVSGMREGDMKGVEYRVTGTGQLCAAPDNLVVRHLHWSNDPAPTASEELADMMGSMGDTPSAAGNPDDPKAESLPVPVATLSTPPAAAPYPPAVYPPVANAGVGAYVVLPIAPMPPAPTAPAASVDGGADPV